MIILIFFWEPYHGCFIRNLFNKKFVIGTISWLFYVFFCIRKLWRMPNFLDFLTKNEKTAYPHVRILWHVPNPSIGETYGYQWVLRSDSTAARRDNCMRHIWQKGIVPGIPGFWGMVGATLGCVMRFLLSTVKYTNQLKKSIFWQVSKIHHVETIDTICIFYQPGTAQVWPGHT